MSDMRHTNGRWEFNKATREIGILSREDDQSYGMMYPVIARMDNFDTGEWEGNGNRIVACVNALEGIPNKDLEGWPGTMGQKAMMQAEEISRLTAEVVRLTKNSADSYCARCGLVIPYVYPLGSCECPECGNTMLPSSENLREIATLKAEVARLREVLSEAEAIAIDHLNLLEAQGWTRHQANEIAITKTMLENIREALATRQEE